MYESKYTIPIDHGILNDHEAFYREGLSNELIFELRLRPASNVGKGSDPTQVTDELTNIELDCEVINNVDLSNAVILNYCSGKSSAFSARHKGICIWVLTQQITSIAKPFRENTAALVLFNISSAKDMKIIFESYARELTREKKSLMDGS